EEQEEERERWRQRIHWQKLDSSARRLPRTKCRDWEGRNLRRSSANLVGWVSALHGHMDLATTQRYMHLSPAAIEGAIRLLDRAKPVHGFGDILETADRDIGKSLP